MKCWPFLFMLAAAEIAACGPDGCAGCVFLALGASATPKARCDVDGEPVAVDCGRAHVAEGFAEDNLTLAGRQDDLERCRGRCLEVPGAR